MKDLLKKYSGFVIVGLVIIVSLLTSLLKEKPIAEINEPIQEYNGIEYIYVDIKGEVHNPGVYKVNEDLRLYQLVNLAGGLTNEADGTLVNLSSQLFDEDVIYIPSIYDETSSVIGDIPVNEVRLDINQANLEQLQELPGIGPSTAQKIIDYRKEVGYFEDIEDIINVPGIGESTFNNIKDLIKT